MNFFVKIILFFETFSIFFNVQINYLKKHKTTFSPTQYLILPSLILKKSIKKTLTNLLKNTHKIKKLIIII
jgi:hypothetical protein